MNERTIFVGVFLSLTACADSGGANDAFRTGGDNVICFECLVEKTATATMFVHRGEVGGGWIDPTTGNPVYDAVFDKLELEDGSVLKFEEANEVQIGAYTALVWPDRGYDVPNFEKTACTGSVPSFVAPPDLLPVTALFDEVACDLPVLERSVPMSECDFSVMFANANWDPDWDACGAR